MKSMVRAFPLALKMIFTDPVNFILALIPTIIAILIYLLIIAGIYRNSDRLVSLFRGYIFTPDQATILAKLLTAVLIIFVFFIMSWTFVLIVGIISAPFNFLLSSRIEEKLTSHRIMDEDHKHALKEVKTNMLQTFKNEFKKIGCLVFIGCFAFVLNLIPFLYPIALFLIATLLAVQFVDYSWSRHNLVTSDCCKDVARNIVPYFFSGIIFLGMVAIPVVNALVPAFATSYFTVLWLDRNKRI
jgi:uncharacterized protein involved in cysteine biosynthesis